MSIRESINEEAKRTPLTLALNAVMTITAIVSLWIALRQPKPLEVAGASAQLVPNKSSYSIWLTIAVYLSVTLVGASICRSLYRANAWAALMASLVLSVLSLFLTTWAAQRLGLNTSSDESGQAFGNLIFYGTVVIYLAVAGGRPLIGLARTGYKTHETEAENQREALGTFLMLAIAILIWGAIVGAGQTAAIKAFL